jgi:hypothetical protein
MCAFAAGGGTSEPLQVHADGVAVELRNVTARFCQSNASVGVREARRSCGSPRGYLPSPFGPEVDNPVGRYVRPYAGSPRPAAGKAAELPAFTPAHGRRQGWPDARPGLTSRTAGQALA